MNPINLMFWNFICQFYVLKELFYESIIKGIIHLSFIYFILIITLIMLSLNLIVYIL